MNLWVDCGGGVGEVGWTGGLEFSLDNVGSVGQIVVEESLGDIIGPGGEEPKT